nr:DUF4837 family protein [Flavobacterium sp. 28A]
MSKVRFLFFLIPLFLFSCKQEDSIALKNTSGKINTISIIIDDQLWNGEVGDSIRNKFAAPVIGLPQEEPLFTINQYPVKLMEGFMTDSRNIILIKKDTENHFQIKENIYAKPQNVFCISGKSTTAILELIENKTPQIIQTIRDSEIKESQTLNRKTLLDTKKLTEKFQISMAVPSDYQYVVQEPKFIWLKKEIISGNTSILIYEVPLKSLQNANNLVGNIIKKRDSIGSLYIHGKEPNTDMITEEAYSPYFFQIKLDGKLTYEMKGTWVLKNDFMSGPFINYSIMDPDNNRALIIEGFCYSPSKEKRDLMHELEAIIKSVAVIKR